MRTPEVGKAISEWQAGGGAAAFGRITELRGIGSAAYGELFARNEAGDTVGGLLGGNRPQHIGLAVCAGILAGRNRRDGASLRGRTAPIRGGVPTESAPSGAPLGR